MPNKNSKTYIVNDQPTEKDALDFTPYVETLADIIQTGNTPLTIGVFGTWGSGKTSLMKMVKKQLPDDFTVAWFDAWKYDKEESLWRAFLLGVLSALKERASLLGNPLDEFEKLQSLIYRDMEIEKVGGVTIDLAKLGSVTAKGLAQLSLSFIPRLSSLTKLVEELQSGVAKNVDEATTAIRRERTKIYIEQIQFLEQFQGKFRVLVEQHVTNNNGRFVVFVDDLDRCLPEKAIEVLEAIKLFLDAENCVFILGLDQEVIARSIEMKYKEFGERQDINNQRRFTIEGVRYLEKIVQLPFQIPPVEENDMGEFVRNLSADWPHDECPKVFAEGMQGNPRQLKRIVNVFLMLWKLSQKRQERLQEIIKPIRLAKIVLIQMVASEFYSLIREKPQRLIDLENYFRFEMYQIEKLEKKGSLESNRKEPEKEILNEDPQELSDAEKMKQEYDTSDLIESETKDTLYEEDGPTAIELSDMLSPFSSNQFLQRILTMHSIDIANANFSDLKVNDVRLYFTLTHRIETPSSESYAVSKSIVKNITGKEYIFDREMVRIRAGAFRMGISKEQMNAAINAGLDRNLVEREYPRHIVELSEFYISKFPVTNLERA